MEFEYEPIQFFPGQDFDPTDSEEVGIVFEASRRDYQNYQERKIEELRAENNYLREMLNKKR